jgi:hypothetical protein
MRPSSGALTPLVYTDEDALRHSEIVISPFPSGLVAAPAQDAILGGLFSH